jgi:hypothetical protein
MTGDAADQAREADARHRVGDSAAAIRLLEEALSASIAKAPVYPGWLCGRLAALYRTLGRYDDEVRLLERYRESQTSEEARTRYDARLCKARAIAERKRRRDSGALDSVRASIGRPRTRRPRRDETPVPPALGGFGDEAIGMLATALAADADLFPSALRVGLDALIAEGQAVEAPAELLVTALKTALAVSGASNGVSAEQRSARYSDALVQLLALYFEEEAS